jgi:hypothetical protein
VSRNNLWLICHKNRSRNNYFTETIVEIIRKRNLTSKQVAKDLVISTERVRNWYYRSTGMTAHDLLLLMGTYDFIRDFVDKTLSEYSS